MFANTENRMTLRVLDTAQWERCAAKLLSIPAIILLFGETQKCLYLSQISTDFNSVKKHLFASVLPHLLSTHLTSSFNIWMVQIWPRTFPLCIDDYNLQNLCRWCLLQKLRRVKFFLLNIFNENGKVPSDIPSDTKKSIRVVH